MIKANELRIGNYYEQFGNIHQVNGHIISELQKAPESQLWFKPIRLTEEWMLKFGFVTKKTMSDTFVAPYPDNYYHIIKHHGIYVFRCAGCSLQRVNYVHQLQNLYFALTGEELTIKE